jgi:hypothetical protein
MTAGELSPKMDGFNTENVAGVKTSALAAVGRWPQMVCGKPPRTVKKITAKEGVGILTLSMKRGLHSR